MPKALRIAVYAASAVVMLLSLAVVAVYAVTGGRMNQVYAVADEMLPLPDDSASLAEGERLATLLGCTDCHGANLAGRVLVDAPVFAVVWAPNLTRGQGGVGEVYAAADFERAIRHGVGKDGRPLLVMPALDFQHLSDQDVGRLVAYLLRVPAVDHRIGDRKVGPAGRLALLGNTGALLPATVIDHTAGHPDTVERGVSAEYGAYLAGMCVGCHNPEFTGGPMAGGTPGSPPAANLTPDRATGLGAWTEADFARAVREGIRPDGSELDAAMPWRAFGGFTDDEVAAMWRYLRSLEAKPPRAP